MARNRGRLGHRRRRQQEYCDEYDSEESDDDKELEDEIVEPSTATVTTRCFPLRADQRRVLQGCRALVETRFDVRVEPPSKDSADGRGTVTGAPEDVAYALDELRRVLCPAANPADTKACVTKAKGNKGKSSKAKGKENKAKGKDSKANGNESKDSKAKGNNKQTAGKQKKK